MKRSIRLSVALLSGAMVLFNTTSAVAAGAKPLRALLIAGGCCHDYTKQKDILKKGLEELVNVQIEILYSPDNTTRARFAIYEKPDWAKGFDVIIHDECSSDVTSLPYVQNILRAHREGVAAVNLHCAMHCYRTGTEDWFQFVGIQSSAHGPQEPIVVRFLAVVPVEIVITQHTSVKEMNVSDCSLLMHIQA